MYDVSPFREFKVEGLKPKEAQPQPEPKHHSGKGTRARLNTAAEKQFFSKKYS